VTDVLVCVARDLFVLQGKSGKFCAVSVKKSIFLQAGLRLGLLSADCF